MNEKFKIKKLLKYILVGLVVLIVITLNSCMKTFDQTKTEKPIIYDVNFEFADKIGDIILQIKFSRRYIYVKKIILKISVK